MCFGQQPIPMKVLGQVTPTSATDLYGLDAELQHLVAGRAGEVHVDAGQRGEHELLGQLVDQRHAQPLLQVHQHLGNRWGHISVGRSRERLRRTTDTVEVFLTLCLVFDN